MQHETVEYDGINYHFPINIARKRTKKDIWDKYLLTGVFTGVGCWLSPLPWFEYLVTSNSYCYCFHFSMEVLSRLTYFREEYSHLESRYEGRILFLLKKLFSFNRTTVCSLSFSVLVIAIREIIGASITKENICKYITVGGIYPWLCSLTATKLFVDNIQMEKSHTAKLIDELKGLDYGSGMAHSYFHGYLNLILPCTGDERKGLKEQIEDYESRYNVNIPSKKLYILIPSSAYCPTSLVNCSNIIHSAESLEWRIMDRAGVRGRPYKNSVYKLIPDENEPPVYVCAEYATPLLTLYEVINYNSDDSRLYKKYQQEIVTNFYLTLQKIIKESRDCRDLAELIYYKDVDNDGNPLQVNELDVGLLLLENINQDRSNINV